MCVHCRSVKMGQRCVAIPISLCQISLQLTSERKLWTKASMLLVAWSPCHCHHLSHHRSPPSPPTLTLTLIPSLACSLTNSHTHTLSLTHTLTHSLTHSLTPSHTRTLTHTFTHAHTHSLPLSPPHRKDFRRTQNWIRFKNLWINMGRSSITELLCS